jgi:F0F1-type ATP synthase membrane subunit c/vacuolar-type H+-ATPase subunit K
VSSRQTTARVKHNSGSELVVQDNRSDAPLLPIDGIERLHQIRPDRVDWVFDQTELEADGRRKEQRRINTFVFAERIAAIAAALLMGLSGILGGIYAGFSGHAWLGGTIATATIGTLAVAFLTHGKDKQC